MRIGLEVLGAGAVTPAGLTVRQTCAAIRAGLTGFGLVSLAEPLGTEQQVARIPGHWSLRPDAPGWLASLAARALREALSDAGPPQGAGRALFLIPPESARSAPDDAAAPQELLDRLLAAVPAGFNPASRVLDGGAAAALGCLALAAETVAEGAATEVLVLGVDSLVNPADLRRLGEARRLAGPDNAQGLVPGEGAVALRLGPRGAAGSGATALLAVATAREADTVDGPRFSQGRGLVDALRAALADGALEPQVDWVLSNANGERYALWEATLAHARFYRTRRPNLPVVYPAASVGEIGSASAPLLLLVAHDALHRGHAPGRIAACEALSDNGLRSVAVLGAAT